jgi:8-oxo-dGTP pyrophosphatase MutT (NUDIX family)
VREELGVEVQVEAILGTTHFYRGEPVPENELVGVVYFCSLHDPAAIHISPEHSEFRWLPVDEALALLTARDPSTQWARRVIERAELLRAQFPQGLIRSPGLAGFELG